MTMGNCLRIGFPGGVIADPWGAYEMSWVARGGRRLSGLVMRGVGGGLHVIALGTATVFFGLRHLWPCNFRSCPRRAQRWTTRQAPPCGAVGLPSSSTRLEST